jgi:hypothetical protein
VQVFEGSAQVGTLASLADGRIEVRSQPIVITGELSR